MTLLSHVDSYGGYNDIWGYAAPNGKEYAIVGTTTGTSIVDVTNPTSPVERAFIPGPSSSWRDIRTYQTYAYIVTEGGGGIQIVDLTNPDSPSLIQTWGTSNFSHAHNIAIDTGTGRIYACGTNVGTVVADASINPTNPTFIGNWGANYVHDLCVENGLAYRAEINNGVLGIYDLSTWPPTLLSSRATIGNFTHNVWPNAAGTFCVTTDEVTNGRIQVWDVSNPANPVALANYTPNTSAIVHNAFVKGDKAYVSWYTEGVRVLDLSNPSSPVEVASYDTWPGTSGGYNGCWGVYPYLPSGIILANDISTGLYVLAESSLQTSHTPLGDTTDEDGPYTVTLNATSNQAITQTDLSWSVNGGAITTVAMTPAGPGQYTADIPGQYAVASVSYHFQVADGGPSVRVPSSGGYQFTVGSGTTVYSADFEVNDGGWTHGMSRTQDDWQWGTPAGSAGDPGSAYSGSRCWGNDLGPAGWNGQYQPNVTNWLDSPVINTQGVQGLRLRFARWLTVESGQYDQARLLVNGQLVWVNPSSGDTIDTSWQVVEYDVSAILNNATTAQIRFQLDTDGGVNLGGWNIDDVALLTSGDCVPPKYFGTGTAGTGGAVPTVALGSPAQVGNAAFSIDGANLVGNAPTALALGPGQAALPLGGLTILVDPLTALVFPALASGAAGQAGAGAASIPLPIPNDPSFDNADVYAQWIVIDAGASGGLAGSDSVRVRFCLN